MPCGERELLGERVVRGHRREPGVDERSEPAVAIGADGDALLGVRTTPDQPVHALTREGDSHWMTCDLRRGRPEQMMGPQRLPAKSATDIGRREMDLLLVDTEHLRERPGVPLHALAGVMDDQLDSVPRQRDRVGFDRVVIVARGRVRQIDRVRGVDQCGLRIADEDLDRLADEAVGRPRMSLASSKVRGGAESYVTSINEAAWSACSCVSARTIAIGSPFQWMRGSCMTGKFAPPAALGPVRNIGGGCFRGELRWVITSTTPAAASAAPVSSVVMAPRAIVLYRSAA